MSDVADVYARLSSETAKLLGFDVAALSPAQDVRVSMVAGLRLEFDRLQIAQLRGEAIDPKALVAISEQLEAALRPAEVVERPGPARRIVSCTSCCEGRHRAQMAEWARESRDRERGRGGLLSRSGASACCCVCTGACCGSSSIGCC